MMPRLDPETRRAYLRTLVEDHQVETEVDVLNMNERVVGRLRGKVMSGQVTVDRKGEKSTRVTSLVLLDQGDVLRADPNQPDGAALFADRLVSVTQIVSGPRIPNGVRVPVHYGPVRGFAPDGALKSVELHDMSALGRGTVRQPRSWPKGARKTRVLRDILTEVIGYKRVIIPPRPSRLGAALNLKRGATPWLVAEKLAKSMSCQLLAREDGVIVVRPLPQDPAWVFTDGDGGSLLGDGPKVTPDWTDYTNAALVRGARPEGAKSGIVKSAVADRDHFLSPWNLGLPDGDGLWQETVIEDSNIRCEEDALRLARETVREGIRMDVKVELLSLPIYHLSAGDLVALDTEDHDREFRPPAFAFGLGGEPMTVGYTRKVTPTVRTRR